MTDDLVRWLGKQLDEDERTARAATPGPWRAHDTHLGQYGYTATVLSGEGNDTDLRAWFPSMSEQPWDETRNVWNDAEHVARHDPARVLREIDAKRGIFAEHTPRDGRCRVCTAHADGNWTRFRAPCSTLRLLAAVYAGRPGFRKEWAP